jgi:hypothetical protein
LTAQFLGPQRIRNVIRPPDTYVNDLQTFFVPDSLNLFTTPAWRPMSAHWTGNPAEWSGYLGIPLIALLAFVAFSRIRRPLVRFAAFMTALCLVLSMGPHLHVGGQVTRVPLLWHAPSSGLLANMLPGRLMAFGDLFAGMTLALGLDPLMRIRGPKRAGVIAAAVLAVVALTPEVPLVHTSVDIPQFFTRLGPSSRIPAGSVALIAPFASGGEGGESMLWQANAGLQFRTPQGYALRPDQHGSAYPGPEPSTLGGVMLDIAGGGQPPPLHADTMRTLERELHHMEVRTVIVGPMRHGDVMTRFFTALLGRSPEATGGCLVWWDVDR